jgi:hypothetical protein
MSTIGSQEEPEFLGFGDEIELDLLDEGMDSVEFQEAGE